MPQEQYLGRFVPKREARGDSVGHGALRADVDNEDRRLDVAGGDQIENLFMGHRARSARTAVLEHDYRLGRGLGDGAIERLEVSQFDDR